TGLGFTTYNDDAPPPTGLFAPPSIDLSNSDLEEFQYPKIKGYGPKDSKSVCVDTSNDIKKAPDAPIIGDWVSDNDEDKNFAPTAVLTKSGIVPISTARQSSLRVAAPVNVARPINTVASKPLVNVAKPRQNALQTSHSLNRRPFYQQTAVKNRNLNNNVNTAKENSINTSKGNNVTSDIGNQGLMLLSPQHAGFGDLKLKSMIMSLKTVDHTFINDLTMLIQKEDSSQ
nr:hypothetical protein [Tanacetum cinerariifolium]